MTNKILLGILAIIVVVSMWGMGKYNNLVVMSNDVDAQFAQVDSVLQRRMDSIDQAVGALKISNKNEQDALQKITDARRIYQAAGDDTEAKIAAANNYNGTLNGILLARGINGEAYPNLQTPQLVGGLMGGTTIEGNENRINVERMRYNEKVQAFNNQIITFPGNLIAGFFGFQKKSYFELVDPAAKNAPQIGKDLNF